MTIKKNFVEIIELLESNKNKPVSSILEQITELCTSKKKSETVRRDDSGKVTEIFCWYHKVWEPVDWYGLKSSSNSGFNTMCKQGVNSWTRQQTEYKKKVSSILDLVETGKIQIDQIDSLKEKYKKEKDVIKPRVDK